MTGLTVEERERYVKRLECLNIMKDKYPDGYKAKELHTEFPNLFADNKQAQNFLSNIQAKERERQEKLMPRITMSDLYKQLNKLWRPICQKY